MSADVGLLIKNILVVCFILQQQKKWHKRAEAIGERAEIS